MLLHDSIAHNIIYMDLQMESKLPSFVINHLWIYSYVYCQPWAPLILVPKPYE